MIRFWTEIRWALPPALIEDWDVEPDGTRLWSRPGEVCARIVQSTPEHIETWTVVQYYEGSAIIRHETPTDDVEEPCPKNWMVV